MPFITKSTLNLLLNITENVEIDKKMLTQDFFIEHIYNDPMVYFIFNKFQIDKLYKTKFILNSDENTEFNNVLKFKPLPNVLDPKNTVFYKGKDGGAYHLYSDCKTLNGNYVDFFIPQDIQDLEKLFPKSNAVERFRRWFNGIIYEYIQDKVNQSKYYSELYEENKNLHLNLIVDIMGIEINNSLLIPRYNAFIVKQFEEYKDENGENIVKKLNLEYKLVEAFRPNSGNQEIKTIDDLHQEITEIVKERNQLCLPDHYGQQLFDLAKFSYCYNKDNSEIRKIIQGLQHANGYKNMILNVGGIDKVKEFWKKHHKLSQKAYNVIFMHFMNQYGLSSKEFSAKTLEAYNIHCCGTCKERKIWL